MANRLAGIEQQLAQTRQRTISARGRNGSGAAGAVAPTDGMTAAPQRSASIARGLSALGAPSVRDRSRPLTLPLDYSVTEPVQVVAQPTDMTCWAAATTTMMAWRNNEPMTLGIEGALQQLGDEWLQRFRNNQGLPLSEMERYLGVVGLSWEYPQSLSIEGWERMLRTYGPVLVVTDEDVRSGKWAVHARVVVGIVGDGTPDGTRLRVVDPAGGRRYDESITAFIPKYEEIVIEAGIAPIQLVHWPSGAQRNAGLSLSVQRTAARARGLSVLPPAVTAEADRLRAEGVDEATIQEALGRLRGDASAAAALGQRTVALPSPDLLDGVLARLLLAGLSAGPIGLLVEGLFQICDRANVTIGVGPAITGGLVVGGSGGVGVVFAPGRQVGVYGDVGAVLGAVVSISASIQVTVVKGGPSRFEGRSVQAGASLDTGLGPQVGGHLLIDPSTGEVIGVTGEIGISAGLSPFEAFVQFVTTGSTLSASPRTARAASLWDTIVRWIEGDIPLTPANGGMSIPASTLEVGDIIVSTTDAASSGLIRHGTGSEVSHAAIYVGDGLVVEALGDGVKLNSLEEALSDDSLAVAFRYPGLTDQQRQTIKDHAGHAVGRSYGWVGVVRHALFKLPSSICDDFDSPEYRRRCRSAVGRVALGEDAPEEFFCSELVVSAYQAAGISLTNEPAHYASPNDLVQLSFRNVLEYVGHLKA